MKKTFKDLLEADLVVGALYEKNPTLKDTKFGYAWTRFYTKNIEPTRKEMNEELMDARVEYALTDTKTLALVLDEKSRTGYAHSKDDFKKLLTQERKIFDSYTKKEIEVEPHISSEIPKDITEIELESLKGLVL